jgi:amino acid transporter
MTGFSDNYALFISFLPAAMTFTGYDSAALVAEETIGAAKTAPLSIIFSILCAFPIGFISIIALLSPISPSSYAEISQSPITTTTISDIFLITQGREMGLFQTIILTVTGIFSCFNFSIHCPICNYGFTVQNDLCFC